MPHAFAENHHSDGFGLPDRLIGWLANRQHGVVSLWQLREFGLTRGQIELRLRRGRLVRLFDGVYAVGHGALSQEGIWMAAVLAGREDAALSHFSAAALLSLRRGGGPRSHVSVPRRRRSSAQIAFHFAELPPDEITLEKGIPVTSPGRTILDQARIVNRPVLRRMLEAAENKSDWVGPTLPELIERYPRRPGVPALCELCATPLARTRSDLEASFIDFLNAAGVEPPEQNQVVAGYEVDFVWFDKRVIVEVDAFATHGSTFAFERDRERDRRLRALGWTVVRVTERQMDQRAADDLRRLVG